MLPETIAKLTVEEKVRLIEELWDDIEERRVADHSTETPQQWQIEILEARMKDNSPTLSWEEFKQFLAAL